MKSVSNNFANNTKSKVINDTKLDTQEDFNLPQFQFSYFSRDHHQLKTFLATWNTFLKCYEVAKFMRLQIESL